MNNEFLIDRMHERLIYYLESLAGGSLPKEMKAGIDFTIEDAKKRAKKMGGVK